MPLSLERPTKSHHQECRASPGGNIGQSRQTPIVFAEQHAVGRGEADIDLIALPFSFTRLQVIERFGPPSESGGRINDPILGEYGAWDRFARPGYAIHVEHRVDADRVKKITLMRADVQR